MIVEGRSPEDPWIRRCKRLRPRQGVALSAYSSSATPWRGRISLSGSSFPGFSALRASTPGLKSDDPSGALPLRDRQAVAAGRGSVDRIAQRHRDYHFFALKLKCVTPGHHSRGGFAKEINWYLYPVSQRRGTGYFLALNYYDTKQASRGAGVTLPDLYRMYDSQVCHLYR